MKDYKIVVMGGGGVGKSCLTIQFCHELFVERYDPTIEDSYRKIITVDGTQVTVEILDTAGSDQFVALHSLYVRSGHGFILVFALNSPDSLHELEALHESVVRIKDAERGASDDGFFYDDDDHRSEDAVAASSMGRRRKRAGVPIVLCGNKSDLESERMVQRAWAVEMSKQWGDVPYYETSARKRVGVDDVFHDLIRQMIKADAETGRPLGGRHPSGLSSAGGLGFGALTGRRRNRRRKGASNGPAGSRGGNGPQCVIL